MKRYVWPTLLILLVASAIVVWLMKPAADPFGDKPKKMPVIDQSTTLEKLDRDARNRQDSPAATNAAPSRATFIVDRANQEIIRGCLAKSNDLPTVRYTDSLQLENVIDDLMASRNPRTTETLLNLSVRRPDGREQRLQIGPRDEAKKKSKFRWTIGNTDARVFDVDAEDLPVPVEVPEMYKMASSATELAKSFVAADVVVFEEHRSHKVIHLPDGRSMSADTTLQNAHLTQVQLFFGASSLGCAWEQQQLTCKCL